MVNCMIKNKLIKLKSGGLTLLETLVVLAVSIVIASVALSNYMSYLKSKDIEYDINLLNQFISGFEKVTTTFKSHELQADGFKEIEKKDKAYTLGLVPRDAKYKGDRIIGNHAESFHYEVFKSDYGLSAKMHINNMPTGSGCIKILRSQLKNNWEVFSLAGSDIAAQEVELIKGQKSIMAACSNKSKRVNVSLTTKKF